jgi:phosphoenolpyruvate phosphomutase
MRSTTRLRALVRRPETAFLMEAHDGLSARIAAEAGFEGLWASGLTMSASFGVRDNNELAWSQVVEHVGFMADAAGGIPILVDGDTGYGNFNNMRRLVRKLEQVGAAGVTIEDKLFPKTNSFLRSERQPLADVDEFCGKLKAGKDSQADSDFVVVARVEALIAGWGLSEAIRRAEAYHLAGADAILIHSRQSSAAEIFAFLDAWANRSPVVLVPTKYWRTPTDEFRARSVSVVVWANHLLRSAIGAMQDTARRLHAEASLLEIEPQVAPLQEVFRLQGDQELEDAERRYLPVTSRAALSAVVLAAGPARTSADSPRGCRRRCSRCRAGRSSAACSTTSATSVAGEVTVVRGYRAEAVEAPGAASSTMPISRDRGGVLAGAGREPPSSRARWSRSGTSSSSVISSRRCWREAGDGITLSVDSALAGTRIPSACARRAPTPALQLRARSAGGDRRGRGAAGAHGAWIGLLHVGGAAAPPGCARPSPRPARTARSPRRRSPRCCTRVVDKGGR